MPDYMTDLLSTLQAPGAQQQQAPPPDVMQALQAQQQGGAMPGQAQAAQQFMGPSQGAQQVAPQTGDFQANSVQELMKELQNLSNPSKSEQEFQKRSAYTIEQRAADKYNEMFGISKSPKTVAFQGPHDPNNPSGASPGDPMNTGQTGTKIDWKKWIPSTLSEMARAFVQKGEYVPAKERLHQQAQAEYQQELGPLAREVQYDNMNRRAAYRDATSLVNNMATNQQRAAANDIRKQAVANQGILGQSRSQYYDLKGQELEAEITAGLPDAKAKLANLKAEQEQELSKLTQSRTANQNITNDAMEKSGGAKPTVEQSDIDRLKYYKSIGDTDSAGRLQKSMDAKVSTDGSKNVSIQKDAQGNWVRINKADNSITPMTGGSGSSINDLNNNSGPNNANSTPKPVIDPVTGKSDKYSPLIGQYYPDISAGYRGAAVAPTAVNFKDDLPDGTDPRLAAFIHAYPIKTATQGTEKMKNEAAMKGYSSAQELYGLLKDFSPSDLGTLKGQWTKLSSEYSDPRSWTKTPSDKYARFAVAAQILGANHSVTQGFRSSQFVDEIGKTLNALQTNKQVIGGKIYQFEKTFMDHLSQHPELKGGSATRNWTAENVVKGFHPDAYKQIYGKDPGPPDYGKYGQQGPVVTAKDLK